AGGPLLGRGGFASGQRGLTFGDRSRIGRGLVAEPLQRGFLRGARRRRAFIEIRIRVTGHVRLLLRSAPTNVDRKLSGEQALRPLPWLLLLQPDDDDRPWGRCAYLTNSTCSKSSSTGVARPKIETETLTLFLSK